jgi:predicted dehydrogenase
MTAKMNRRDFLTTSMAGGVTALGAFARPAWASPQGANDAVRVAVVGVRGQGNYHLRLFKKTPGVRIVAICDIDQAVLDERAGQLAAENIQVAKYTDVRKLLESKDVDAISIATPNHWHSLMAVWACQAGKDVYVEKPVSHNVWEGRKIAEAAAKYGRIVQAGTQSRSDEALHELAAYLKTGQIGKILRARGLCYKRRDNIGKVAGPQTVPPGVDYDLFCGPSELMPLRRKQLHYDWHWVWPTGNGDIGNQGIHEMDMCRWMLGEEQLPPRVFAFGGRFGYDDDAETPNTLVAVLDYPAAPLIFEVRGLPAQAGANYMDHYKGVRIGITVECEHGYFAGGAGGGIVYDNDGKRIKALPSAGGGAHIPNFIAAVRSRKPSDVKAPVLGGHLSSALCHLPNISYRLGTQVPMADVKAQFASRADVAEAFDRFSAHLTANGVDVAKTAATLGPVLELQPAEERFTSRSGYDMGAWANRMLRDSYRAPYVMPEQV